MITTEGILCSPHGFDLTEATPVQRARCRIGDGLPLLELRDHPDVVAMVGGPAALAALPSERGIAPAIVVDLSSIRSAKTLMALARAVRASQSVDVSGLKRGEVPRIPILNLRLDRARTSFRVLLETVRTSSVLRPLLLEETAESLMLRHPSGRPIEIAPVAGAKAGANLVGDWFADLIADEAPRMNGSADDAVINLDHALDASAGRMLPAAQIQLIGSPWAPMGPVYNLVQEHWGKPSEHIVVLRSTGPQNNPSHWTPERCETMRLRNPISYKTDVLGEFADPESGLISPIAVHRSTREKPLELPRDNLGAYGCAIDPSEGSEGGNPWTLVVVQAESIQPGEDEQRRSRYRVVVAREWRGQRPEQCWKEIAQICRTYGIRSVQSDQYAASANADIARRFGLNLVKVPWTAANKLDAFKNLATLIHQDLVELSPHRVFINDLMSVRRRITQAGETIVLPSTSDGRHCDFAPALARAIQCADQGAPTTAEQWAIMIGASAPAPDRLFGGYTGGSRGFG